MEKFTEYLKRKSLEYLKRKSLDKDIILGEPTKVYGPPGSIENKPVPGHHYDFYLNKWTDGGKIKVKDLTQEKKNALERHKQNDLEFMKNKNK